MKWQYTDVIELMRTLTRTRPDELPTAPFCRWTEYWLHHYCTNLKETTLASYKQSVTLHIDRVLGKIPLCDIDSEVIQLFINSLILGVGIAAPLSPKSIKNIYGVLHRCLDIAYKSRYIKENPTLFIILPRVEKALIQPLTTEQIKRFLLAIQGHEKETLFKFALFTGLRQGEIIGLTWDCIDFSEGTIHVYRQIIKEKRAGGAFKFSPLKNSKPRKIMPAPLVIDLLKDLKAKDLYFQSEFVFRNQYGKHYTHAAVYNSFKKVMRKLGFDHARFHDLRHTYAVLSLQAGDDFKTLQENMGHHSAAFTLDVYGHCTDEMRKASSARMEKYIQTNVILNESEECK